LKQTLHAIIFSPFVFLAVWEIPSMNSKTPIYLNVINKAILYSSVKRMAIVDIHLLLANLLAVPLPLGNASRLNFHYVCSAGPAKIGVRSDGVVGSVV